MSPRASLGIWRREKSLALPTSKHQVIQPSTSHYTGYTNLAQGKNEHTQVYTGGYYKHDRHHYVCKT